MIGMLWADFSNKPLEEKVRLAAAYYEWKYGRKPTTIAVDKKTLSDQTNVDGMTILPKTGILRNHMVIQHDQYTRE